MAKRWLFVVVVWGLVNGSVPAQLPPHIPPPNPSSYLNALQFNAFGKQPTTADLQFNAFARKPEYDQSLHGAVKAGIRDQAFLGPRLLVEVDYLVLFIQPPTVPPLLTTGSSLDTVPGALGQPNTRILDVGERDYGPLAGARLRLGWTIIDQLSLDSSFFISEQRSNVFDRNSDANGNPLLARPFFDLQFGEQQANRIAEPGVAQGFTHSSLSTRILGAESVVRWSEAPRNDGPVWSMFGGFNFVRFDEQLFDSDVSLAIPAGTGSNFTFTDHFSTSNRLYAAQFGAQLDCCFPDGVLTVFGKVSVGAVEQNLWISGITTETDAGGVTTVARNQGLYAQPTNVGRYDEWEVGAIPEFGISVGYSLHPRVRVNVGYTFMYLVNVIRPADQVQQSITVQTPNAPLEAPFRPVINSFDTTNIWIQHLNFGVGIVF